MKTIKPFTREELEALPASAFPLELECFDMWFVDDFKKITILSPIADTRGHFLVQKHITGHYAALGTDKLCHYPSLKQEPKKVMWYEVRYWKKGTDSFHPYPRFVQSKAHFLVELLEHEANFHFIDLVPIGEYPDCSEVK